MPPIPIERITGIGMITIENSPIATVEPDTITERPACVIVSTTRRLGVRAVSQLLAEAEDHEQRVVDRHAEADQRDEELHDQRDRGHVRQRPDRA